MDIETSSTQKEILQLTGIANRLIDFFQSVSETFVEFKSVDSFVNMIEHLYLSSEIQYTMDLPVDTEDPMEREQSGYNHVMVHFKWSYENVECQMDALIWFDVYGDHVLINYIDFEPSVLSEYGSDINKEYIKNRSFIDKLFDVGVAKTSDNQFIPLSGEPDYDTNFNF